MAEDNVVFFNLEFSDNRTIPVAVYKDALCSNISYPNVKIDANQSNENFLEHLVDITNKILNTTYTIEDLCNTRNEKSFFENPPSSFKINYEDLYPTLMIVANSN